MNKNQIFSAIKRGFEISGINAPVHGGQFSVRQQGTAGNDRRAALKLFFVILIFKCDLSPGTRCIRAFSYSFRVCGYNGCL